MTIRQLPADVQRRYASRSTAANVTLLLNVLVVVYILSAMLLGAMPGLSRVPHASILAIIALLVVKSSHERLRFRLDSALIPVFLFLVLAAASVLWSTDKGSALVRVVGLTTDIAGAVGVWLALQNGVSFRLVAWASAAAASVQALIAVNQFYFQGILRAEGLTGNANSLAIQLSLAAFLLVLTVPRNRWGTILALALMVVATLTTGTRKLLFVWFAYVLVILRDVFGSLLRPTVGKAIVLLLMPAGVWLSLNYGAEVGITVDLQEITFIRRLEGTLEGRGTVRRSGMIEDALEVWAERPVFGHGIDQYRVVGSYFAYSHNNYTELLANFGVVGLLVFYSVYLVVGVRAVMGAMAGDRAAWVVLAILLMYLLMDVARVSYTGRFTWLHLLMLSLLTIDRDRPEFRRSETV